MKILNFIRNNNLVLLFVLLAIAYIGLSLAAPMNPDTLAKYNLDTTQLRLLTFTVIVPYLVIWAIALVGYLRLRTYVGMIIKSKDGQAFKTISFGILWFAVWLPLATIISTIASNYYQVHPESTAALTRIENYTNLALNFPGFLFVYRGTMQLMPIIKKPYFSTPQWLIFGYIIFSALYVLLTLLDPARQVASEGAMRATYYDADWLLITTIIIPRLIMWFMGLQAVYCIYLYGKNVKGTLYRQALHMLAYGLAGVVVIVIALRCLQSLSASLSDVRLTALLSMVYVLLLVMSVGYIMIAKGARKLQRLEEL